MLIGLKKKFIEFIYIIYPLFYSSILGLIITLTYLLTCSPIFLKDHKEFNILFYIHSSFSTFNVLLYLLISFLFLVYFLTKLNILKNLIYIISFYGLAISVLSLISGIYWGYFSWGQLNFFDNKTYLIIFISIIYLTCLIIFHPHNHIINKSINKLLLFIILISLPFWKILSIWWTTLHQAFSISIIGLSFPNNLIVYFFILFLTISLNIFISLLIEIYNYFLN